jgi:hypothetical protein
MPVTGAGNGVAAPATPTAFGTVIPSADPTDAPVGHCAAAVDAVGVGAVVEGADEDAVAVDPGDEPPQAARGAEKASAIKGIQRELLRVTGGASVLQPRASCLPPAL